MTSNAKLKRDVCTTAFTTEAISEIEALEIRKKQAAEPIYLSRC